MYSIIFCISAARVLGIIFLHLPAQFKVNFLDAGTGTVDTAIKKEVRYP